MAADRYRPDHDVTFDLQNGLVHMEGAPGRVLVPADALGVLCASASPEAVASFGGALGRTMGLRIAKRLADPAPREAPSSGDVRAASVETMVDQLGAEIALAGLGSLGVERWGKALVIVIDHCPLGPRGDRLLEHVVGEAIGSAAARDVRAALLGRDGARVRLLVTSPQAADRVKGWLQEGVAWGDALTRLHAAPKAAEAHAT
ncbi:MAG: hypothetical protein U0441_00655 [Polyangiaceae bacterium]